MAILHGWCGSGERDGEKYASNQSYYVPKGLKAQIWRIGAGCGAYLIRVPGRGTSGWACGCTPGGRGEGLRGSYGDAAGIELGSSFAERIALNRGTVPVLRCLRAVFGDEGHSGTTLVRPTLDRLRGPSRRRLRRRGAVLFTGPAGPQVRVPGAAGRVVRQGRGVGGVRQRLRVDSPQDQLLIQFQGMFAEYEKAS